MTTPDRHLTAEHASPQRVDVGIPTFGSATYLPAAIESVLRQTHPSWRLIVSHDGPADADAERAVAPYLGDERITYRAGEHRLGAAGNKTWLINQGAGEYVSLLDHDDLWDETFLERRLRFFAADGDCGFVFSSMRIIGSAGEELKRWRARLPEGIQQRDAFVERLLAQNVIGASSALVRRAAYEAVGARFDERFPRTYDYEMWLRLALAFPVGVLDGFDAAWRVHSDQGTSDLGGLEEEYSLLVDHMWSLVREQAPELHLSQRSQRRKLASLLLTGVLNSLERDDRASAVRYLRRATSTDPLSILDPRAPFAILGVALGQPGRGAVARARAFAHNRGLRLRL